MIKTTMQRKFTYDKEAILEAICKDVQTRVPDGKGISPKKVKLIFSQDEDGSFDIFEASLVVKIDIQEV